MIDIVETTLENTNPKKEKGIVINAYVLLTNIFLYSSIITFIIVDRM